MVTRTRTKPRTIKHRRPRDTMLAKHELWRMLGFSMPKSGIVYLRPHDEREVFERACQVRLGISADEFVRRWNAGEYGDPDKWPNSDLWILSGMIPREP